MGTLLLAPLPVKIARDIAEILAPGVRGLHQEATGELLSQGHLKAVVIGDAVESRLLERRKAHSPEWAHAERHWPTVLTVMPLTGLEGLAITGVLTS